MATRINMNVRLVKIAKLKVAVLLFAVGFVTTVISSYHDMTSWWQQTQTYEHCAALTVR